MFQNTPIFVSICFHYYLVPLWVDKGHRLLSINKLLVSPERVKTFGAFFTSELPKTAYLAAQATFRLSSTLVSTLKQGTLEMKYLHTMIRVTDLDTTINFFKLLGLSELRRYDIDRGRYTLVFLAAPGDEENQIELTYNWDPEKLNGGRNFGHLAYAVEDIYDLCQRLIDAGITINRPPRDGYMAFVRSPDNISVELLQQGEALAPAEPWQSMENIGEW